MKLMLLPLLWNNKPDRVKRNTLIGDITQGGLNMIYIHSFNIYLKPSWKKNSKYLMIKCH
jgi:hypothetical protein